MNRPSVSPLSAAARQPLPAFLKPLPHDVYVIDTGFHRDSFDAAYLVLDSGRAAFVDTGTRFAVPRLLASLQALELTPDAVDWVIPTHVHLDHAGGVGHLMQALPQAKCLVHPRGERHMQDPSALWAGATAVYGLEEMQRSYGSVEPVPATRTVASRDGGDVMLGQRRLHLAHTAGHAKHHHCIWDERSRGWFTGDTFGLSYREFDTDQGPWILPTATPVQFEPEALEQSIQRMLASQPECMYLTHYGRLGESAQVQRLGALLLSILAEMVALGRAVQDRWGADADSRAPRHQALKQGQASIFQRRLAEHGCRLAPAAVEELLAIDLELNAQGMAVWLDR